MRRLLEDIASGDELGDTSTLWNPGVVDDLAEQVETDERRFASTLPTAADRDPRSHRILVEPRHDV